MDANALRNRFHEEQDYIQKYVDFLHLKAAVSWTDVRELSAILSKNNLIDLKTPTMWKWDKPLEIDELENIQQQLQSVGEAIEKITTSLKQELYHFNIPEKGISVDMRSPEGETLQFFIDYFDADQSPKNIENARQEALENRRQFAAMNDLEMPEETEFDEIIQNALFILKSRQLYDLEYVYEKSEHLKIALRMLKPDAEINVLRQAFILLMTIFDATMFDLMRVALKKDFFRLIGAFSKTEKITLERVNRYRAFDELRDAIIEEQLKSKYIKDILGILEGLDIEIINSTSPFSSIHLKEMINRRNIHIHNRGIVDKKYLEPDGNGIAKSNIYNLTVGSIAQIDLSYWETANTLCEDCVDNVTNWVQTL